MTAPLERIKMSFQTSNEVFSFTNAFKKGRSIIYQGNILSLWKGHSMTILRVGPYAAIDYTIHDYAEFYFVRNILKLIFFLLIINF